MRLPTGAVEVDPTGKKSGRGAYLCHRLTCWEEAVKRNRISKALRTTLTEESKAALQAFAATLSDGASVKPDSATVKGVL